MFFALRFRHSVGNGEWCSELRSEIASLFVLQAVRAYGICVKALNFESFYSTVDVCEVDVRAGRNISVHIRIKIALDLNGMGIRRLYILSFSFAGYRLRLHRLAR